METIFRHKLLFLIPMILVPLVTVGITLYAGGNTVIRASVWIEPTHVLENSGVLRISPNKGEGEAINERLKTEAFRQEVLDRTGLTTAIQEGDWPRPSRLQKQLSGNPVLRIVARILRMTPPATVDAAMTMGLKMVEDSIKIDTVGNNLIIVEYHGPDPDLGERLIQETLTLYSEITLGFRLQETVAGLEVLHRQVLAQQERLNLAEENLIFFLEANTAPLPGQQRPPTEENMLLRLNQAYNLEVGLYEATLQRFEILQLTGETASSVRDLNFRVIDPPVVPNNLKVNVRQVAMMGLLGIVLGLILGTLPIVILTWRDGTVRTRGDLEKIIPDSRVVEVPRIPASKEEEGRQLLTRLATGWLSKPGEGNQIYSNQS